MNKPLRRVAIFCGLLMFALLLRDNWIQFVKADDLKTHKANRRVTIERYATPRGDIIVGNKSVTGSRETTGSDFKFKRTYTNGPLYAPVTGFASQAFGANQLESIEDGILTGDDDRLFFNRTVDVFTGKPRQGGNVLTTINPKAQKAAFQGLGGKKGAVAAIDPRSGAILALVSTPSYDPSAFAGNSQKDAKAWKALQKENNPDDPMLNRALRQTYPPGSTFKVVTAAAALEKGLYDDINGKTRSPLPYTMPLTSKPLLNEGNIPCKNATMNEALRVSCNTVFAKMGIDVGREDMRKQSEKFGFNVEHFVPVRAVQSVFPAAIDEPQTGLASIGQGSNTATPLQMAMIAAAIANDGKLKKPYLVDQLTAPDTSLISQTKDEDIRQAVSPQTAQKLQEMMENVVQNGTGQNARIPGVTVGGKTGTAQNGENNKGNPFAWFISYAKSDDGSPVAVAVVVEGSDTTRDDIAGGRLAAPIAKSVMEAVLGR